MSASTVTMKELERPELLPNRETLSFDNILSLGSGTIW
jgi:hypothetical protein